MWVGVAEWDAIRARTNIVRSTGAGSWPAISGSTSDALIADPGRTGPPDRIDEPHALRWSEISEHRRVEDDQGGSRGRATCERLQVLHRIPLDQQREDRRPQRPLPRAVELPGVLVRRPDQGVEPFDRCRGSAGSSGFRSRPARHTTRAATSRHRRGLGGYSITTAPAPSTSGSSRCTA